MSCLLCDDVGEIDLLLTGETIPCPSCSSHAENLLKAHWGHGYLNPRAISASEERPPPIPPSSGVLAVHDKSEHIRALIEGWRKP